MLFAADASNEQGTVQSSINFNISKGRLRSDLCMNDCFQPYYNRFIMLFAMNKTTYHFVIFRLPQVLLRIITPQLAKPNKMNFERLD